MLRSVFGVLSLLLATNVASAALDEDVDAAAPAISVDQEALAAAVQLLQAGRADEAAGRLAALTDGSEVEIPARYHFAKALYRLGFLRSALAEFEGILSEGPDHPFYGAALEWCLFIGRKLRDDTAVNAVLVRYAGGAFPERYRDEFLFRLARYHFTRALVASSEARAPEPPAPAPEDDGGISFEEDLFGDPPPKPARADERRRARAAKKARTKTSRSPSKSKDPGGISIDADLFGDEQEPPSAESETPSTPEEHLEAAKRLALRISDRSDFYPRARFIEALGLVRQGRDNDALAALKQVVELTSEPGEDESSSARRRRERLRELAFFQLARLHFGAKQPSFSIFYYRKVDRDSLQWLDALYEASWAEYRLGSYERSLGNLLTVNAPFFERSYYPESLILKAVIYYENCRYREAGEIITDFLQRYEPVFAELETMAAESRTPESWFALLAELERSSGEGSDDDRAKRQLLARVLEITLGDAELVRLTAAIDEVGSEIEQLTAAVSTPPLAGVARVQARLDDLRSDQASLEAAAGRAVERKLRTEAIAVKELVAQALRVRVETAKAEEGRLEATLNRRDQRPKNKANPVVDWTDDEKLVWPFEGEYWRDELGTYELSLARSCL